MPFLDAIRLTRTLPCLAEPGKIVVVGTPSHPLEEVLPYLAALPNVIAYNPDAGAVTFRRQPGFLTLYTDRVYITQVADTEEGLALLSALTEAINATWEHRDQLVAVTARRRVPRPLDVWALLPQTNCKECGFPTCLAFAMKLAAKQAELDKCPYVSEEARAQLAESAAPPVRLVSLSADGREANAGNEIALFRHEKTFYNPPGLFIRLRASTPLEALKAQAQEAAAYTVEYVGRRLTIDGFAVQADSAEAGDWFGAALEAGDFDGDGYADLAVGVIGEDIAGAADAGAVHLFYGAGGGLNAARNALWHQDSPGVSDVAEEADYFGTALAVGDFNGDGYADLAVAAPEEDLGDVPNAGAVHVFLGAAGGLTAERSTFWHGHSPGLNDAAEANGYFGASLAALPWRVRGAGLYLPLVLRP